MTDKMTGTVQIALRVSPALRERIKAAAEQNGRSVNTELVVTLEKQYPSEDWVAEIVAHLRNQVMHSNDKIPAEDLGVILEHWVNEIAKREGN